MQGLVLLKYKPVHAKGITHIINSLRSLLPLKQYWSEARKTLWVYCFLHQGIHSSISSQPTTRPVLTSEHSLLRTFFHARLMEFKENLQVFLSLSGTSLQILLPLILPQEKRNVENVWSFKKILQIILVIAEQWVSLQYQKTWKVCVNRRVPQVAFKPAEILWTYQKILN